MKHSIRWLPIHRISPVTSISLWYSQAIMMVANLITSSDQVNATAVAVQCSNYRILTTKVKHDDILYDMQLLRKEIEVTITNSNLFLRGRRKQLDTSAINFCEN